jgi:hypothetical protein
MIYFKEKIEPFESKDGMNLVPVEVELIDGSNVYKLPDYFKEEIKAKGGKLIDVFEKDIKKPNYNFFN